MIPSRTRILTLVACVAAGVAVRRWRRAVPFGRRDAVAMATANFTLRRLATRDCRDRLHAVVSRGLGEEIDDLQAQLEGRVRAPR